MTAKASGDAAKQISTLDYHINAAAPGSAEQTALQQARYRIMTEAGLNGVDDVDPFDPEAKAPTKSQNAAVAKQLQAWEDEAVNAGQAAPFTQAIAVLDGGEDDGAE